MLRQMVFSGAQLVPGCYVYSPKYGARSGSHWLLNSAWWRQYAGFSGTRGNDVFSTTSTTAHTRPRRDLHEDTSVPKQQNVGIGMNMITQDMELPQVPPPEAGQQIEVARSSEHAWTVKRRRQRSQGKVKMERDELWSELVSLLSEGSDNDKKLATLRLIKKQKISSRRPSFATFTTCLSAVAITGQVDIARRVFDLMKSKGMPPNNYAYSLLIRSHSEQGRWQDALSLLGKMTDDGQQPDNSNYRAALEVCFRSNAREAAKSLLPKALGMEPTEMADEYRHIIASSIRTGQPFVAAALIWELLDNPGDVKPSAAIIREVMKGCAERGYWEQNLHFLHVLREVDSTNTVADYVSTMDACTVSGNWEKALHLFKEAERQGLTSDKRAHRAALEACAVGGDQETAITLLRQTRETRFQAEPRCWDAALKACCTSRDWRIAVELIDEMTDAGLQPSATSYDSVIRVCCDGGECAIAVALLAEMIDNKLLASITSYHALIKACVEGRDEGRISSVIHLMPWRNRYAISNAYVLAIKLCADRARWEQALSFIRETEDVGLGPDVHHYRPLLKACTRHGDWQRAEAVLLDMHQRGLPVDLADYNDVIGAYKVSGQSREAVEVLRRMTKSGIRPNRRSFELVIRTLRVSGEWEKALGILHEMREARITPSIEIYGAVLSTFVAGSKWEEALTLMQELEATEVCLDEHCYAAVMQACAAAGKWDRAVALLQEMENKGRKPKRTNYSAVISACLKGGNLEMAVDMLKRTPCSDAAMYKEVIRGCLDGDDKTTALSLLEEACEAGMRDDLMKACDELPGINESGVDRLQGDGEDSTAAFMRSELSDLVGDGMPRVTL